MEKIKTSKKKETSLKVSNDLSQTIVTSKNTKRSSKMKVKYVYDGPDKYEPKYAHDGDIGLDVTALAIDYNEEYDCYIYHTGIYSETIEKGTGCFLMPRSSNYKTNSYLCNGVGLVDTVTYRGEICAIFKNRTSIGQEVLDTLFYGYLSLPWYKKLCVNFQEYVNINKEVVQLTCEEAAKNLEYAPYKVGERIGQLVWMKFPQVEMNRVNDINELSKTERGSGGFGSTGK